MKIVKAVQENTRPVVSKTVDDRWAGGGPKAGGVAREPGCGGGPGT
ncbi:hypothetical protein GCM10009755_23020 [Brevibacterium samyangense]|uniref:Uncharacterized protein n=1 Tax=Brevibacterium samyangense TaxID=366888 RepID=A0ABN2TJN4_9MICO